MPERFELLDHNNPGLLVDLGVGLWGWPAAHDANNDGLPDLFVVAGGSPYKGTYYFENTGRKDPETGMDIFKKAVRMGQGSNDITPSYTPAGLRVMGAGYEYPDFLKTGVNAKARKKLPFPAKEVHPVSGRIRGEQWSPVDFDGDGKLDLLVNSVNINFYKNISKKPGEWIFQDMGPVDGKKLAGHSTSPTTADWDGDGIEELMVGAEDEFFYILKNPQAK